MRDCDVGDLTGDLRRLMIRLAAGACLIVLGQTGALIWWASNINTRVDYLERNQTRIAENLDELHYHSRLTKP